MTTQVLLSLLNKKEIQRFIQLLKDRTKRSDMKNVSYIKDVINGEPEALKRELNANAFRVLKKRVNDLLIEFVSNQILQNEQTTEIQLLKWISLSKKLFLNNAFKLGFKLLTRAKAHAKSISDFHLLNTIYEIEIQYSYHELAADQTLLFEQFEANKVAYLNQSRLNMAYAVIRKAFYEQERQVKPLDLEEIIKNNYEKFGVTDQLGYTFKSLYQIAEMADITGTVNRNYYGIDLFFEKYLNQIAGTEQDNEAQHVYHVKLLYLVAHIYYRKKEFNKSISYLNRMQEQLTRFNIFAGDGTLARYEVLLALNLNYSGKHLAASKRLDTYFEKNNSRKNEGMYLQAQLARIMMHFQQGEFQFAKKKMANLTKSDKWYANRVGMEWVLNFKFIELLLHVELGNTSYADARIKSLLRKQKELFQKDTAQGLPFLKMIIAYHENPQLGTNKAFQNKVEQQFVWKSKEAEDLYMMSYYAWIKSKIEVKPLYDVTIALVND